MDQESKRVLNVLRRLDAGKPISKREREILSRVTVLDLYGASITELPASIGQLENLQELDLSYTQITDLPASIVQLENLQTLDLWYTQITDLPASIVQLENLQKLDLSDTPIKDLPASIVQLENLQELVLSHTPITSLPEGIGELPALQLLRLEALTLDEIPRSLALCGLPFRFPAREPENWNAPGIWCKGLRLRKQDISLFQAGPEAIRQLYADGEKRSVRETRLIFLGDAEVGKTYTIRRILNGGRRETKDHPYKTDETAGVEITDHQVEVEGEPLNIHFWDFGGQEILHSMHRCFLTGRTVYLVMVDSRRDNEIDKKARYWLRNVRGFAEDAPVLLMLNCWDEADGKRILNDTGLYNEFPNLKDIVRISAKCAQEKQFIDFMEQLYRFAAASESCRSVIDAKWDNVRREVRKRAEQEHCLTKEKFYGICRDCGIAEAQYADLRRWFNILGVSFSYQRQGEDEALADYQLLDPLWLTNALYALIREGATYAVNGQITRKMVKTILRETPQGNPHHRPRPDFTYNSDECGYVLRIAQQFRLAYLLPNGNAFFPAFFEAKEPPTPTDAAFACDPLHYQMEYSYLPDNVVHQLMVRCMEVGLKMENCWRKGMQIHDCIENQVAVVRMKGEVEENILQISLYAQDIQQRSHFLKRIREMVKTINGDLGLKPEEWIQVGEDRFLLDQLLTAYRGGILQIPGRRKLYSVAELLESVDPDYLREPGLFDPRRKTGASAEELFSPVP